MESLRMGILSSDSWLVYLPGFPSEFVAMAYIKTADELYLGTGIYDTKHLNEGSRQIHLSLRP